MENASEKKRAPKASDVQKEFLINFLEENLDLVNDKFVCVDGAKHRDAKWSQVADSLNGMGGAVKDGVKWRKYWCDLKTHTRAKHNEIRENRSGVNGPKSKTLTPIEERIINLQTTEAIDGDLVPEIGFLETAMVDITTDSTDTGILNSTLSSCTPAKEKGNIPKKVQQKKRTETTPLNKLEMMEEKKLKLLEENNSLLKKGNELKITICEKVDSLISLLKDK